MTLIMKASQVALHDDCPIAWPTSTPPLSTIPPTFSSSLPSNDSARYSIGWVRAKYERTLYLPEPLAPIEQLAKDLFLLSSSSFASSSNVSIPAPHQNLSITTTTTSTTPLSTLPPPTPAPPPYHPLTLTLPQIEQKHRKRLSPPLLDLLTHLDPTTPKPIPSTFSNSENRAIDLKGFEDELERGIWAEGLRYRMEAGVIWVGSSSSGATGGERVGGMEEIEGGDRQAEGLEVGRDREREVVRMRKRLTDEFERREVMIQIILLLLTLLHHPPTTTSSTKRKRNRPPKPSSKSTSTSTPTPIPTPNPSLDPLANLDILSDRLSVWQAIGGNSVSLYTEPDLLAWINGKKKKSHPSSDEPGGGVSGGTIAGEEEDDWVKVFWSGVLWKWFGSAEGVGEVQVRRFLKGMYRKVFGMEFDQGLVRASTEGSDSRKGDIRETRGGEVDSTNLPPKGRLGMKRESSVVSTVNGSTTLGVPARPAMPTTSSSSRRSSMESTTSHRMSFSRDPTPSRAAGSMGPPLPGRRVSGHTPTPSALELDESELELDTRKGGLRRTTSRVNSGVDIFKGREVGFTRTNSFKPVDVGSVAGASGTSGAGGSSQPGTAGTTGTSLGRTSSAMAGMNVILGKRKTMIVPKDKTGPSASGSFVKPSDPMQDRNRQAGGLQKSFSTSTLAMATPSKPRMESRFSGPESQPSLNTQFAPLSAFVAETPSNSVVRRQVAEDRFASNKASLEGTRQVLFPAAGQGELSASRAEDQNLADFMEDTDEEDDGSSFFTSGKRRRLDSSVKETARHVILFRNPHAEVKQDSYLQTLSATKKLRPKCCPVLGQVFIDQEGLVEVIAEQSDKWSGLIATSKRAGEAWTAACRIVQREPAVSANVSDWSRIPLYTPGPATGASFTCHGVPLNLAPRRVEASEETGSAIPLGQFIVEYHASFAPDPSLPILILEGDKNGPNLTETIRDHVTFVTRETYATGPREDLSVDVKQLCQNLMVELGSDANEKTMWLVFFAPSSAKAILDCIETTEYAAGLPFAKQAPIKGILQFRLAAVGNTTATYLRDRGLDVDAVAKQPTAEGVRDALLEAEG